MIVLEPLAGLGNRMRAIDSAIALAEDVEKPLLIQWYRNSSLNCKYDQLFKPNEKFEVKESGYRPFREGRIFNLYFKFKAVPFTKSYNPETSRGLYEKADLHELRDKKSIFIASFHQFYPSRNNLQLLEPLEEIYETIKHITDRFGDNTVGIHIRRTDNIASIKHSPTNLFIQRIDDEIEKNPDTLVFLATDSKDDRSKLVEQYGERILTYSRNQNERDSVKGIQDALVDMYCLSKSTKIFGSYYSSFSETAARLSGIELITLFN